MSRLPAIYRRQMAVALQEHLQYRAGLAFWILGMAVEPVVQLVVWGAVAAARGGEVAGYTAGAFAAYYILWVVVRTMNIALTPWAFEERVRRGGLSPLLLRPVHPFHADLAQFTAMKLVSLVILLPIVLTLSLLFRPDFQALTPLRLAGFLLAIWSGFVLRFIWVWALGLVTFWVLRVSAIFELYFALELILSGRLVPIDLLPAGVRGLALSLPWYYAYGFPIELALGRADAAAIGRGFALQLAWGLVGTGLLALLWRCGVRRYAAVGG